MARLIRTVTRISLPLLLLSAVLACSDEASSSRCRDLQARSGDRLAELRDQASALGATAVGPKCSEDGGVLTLSAEFDRGDLPFDFEGMRYTEDQFEADLRICTHTFDGLTLEVVRIADTATAVVSAASYRLPCG